MNNPNYRIIIEPISEQGAGNLPEELRGVECTGFVLIADKGEHTTTAIQNIGRMPIATAISQTPALMACAHIAKAVREADGMERSACFGELLRGLDKK